MIRLPDTSILSRIERYGLDLLVDLSRLVPLASGAAIDAVRFEISELNLGDLRLGDCREQGWHIQRGEGVVRVPRRVLAIIGTVAGAVSEQRSSLKDRHGRVPSSESPLAAGRFETEATVSRAGGALREAVVASAGRRPVRMAAPWPQGRRWAAALTHDLDLVVLWPLAATMRIAELVRKGRPGLALNVLARSIGALGRDPVWRAVQNVLNREAEHSARSTWFVICENPTLRSLLAGDVTYDPESPPARRILRDLTGRGCEIALHGSFVTSDKRGAFERQRERLGRLAGRPASGVRQHFLRLHPGDTHVWMREAGFVYDSSCGFSDRNGFRVGVADVHPVWNADREELAGIEEAPFCWMDRALSKYRAVEDPGAWVSEGLALAAECRAVNGLWVGVWHPNVDSRLGFPGATDAFERLVGDLAAQHPFFGSLSTMVRWRVARRAIRVTGLLPAGTVAAEAPVGGGFPLRLEDAAGHALETAEVRTA